MTKLTNILPFVLCVLLLCGMARAQVSIHNPLIYADVPDPDVICVGKDYYMISTTCHCSPGAPIMHSRDMKHWSTISYVFDALNDSPRNDLEGGNIYGRGQWAASIRYHKGKFYVFFGTGEKSYIFVASNPAGPWKQQLKLDRYYHDASMLFDDDGRIYLVHGTGKLHISEFNADLTGFKEGGLDQDLLTLGDGCLLEGSHIYKINGQYYITMIWWPRGGIRTELCCRSEKIAGPYEHKTVLSDDLGYPGHGVAQGGIWQATNGEWYAMLFQDHEGVGRIPCLVPVTWQDGWPMMGDEQGHCPQEFTISGIREKGTTDLVCSDTFKEKRLSLCWQWNHNPDNSLWSLTERKGYLRLKTGKVVQTLLEAPNTLTQRTMGPFCQGTAKLDISQMRLGDRCGLMSFCSQPGGITVEKTAEGYQLTMSDRGKTIDDIRLTATTLWLRMECDFPTDTAWFLYSTDGQDFNLLGDAFHMIFSMEHFTGNKFAIFNYATRQAGGWIDVDDFLFQQLESAPVHTQQWTLEQAEAWYQKNPWYCGVNYIPAYAINYTAMWDKTTFDADAIRQELTLMKQLGMNCVRFVMQYVVYEDDPQYFLQTLDTFLGLCQEAGVKAMPIFFDDCVFGTNTDPHVGRQSEPLAGWYAWEWSPSPGISRVVDERCHAGLERYVKDVLTRFKDDSRIMLWDLYNEPTNNSYGELSWPLLCKVFRWARQVNPSQPISSGLWNDNQRLNSFLSRHSDIITFHAYLRAQPTADRIKNLRQYGRPLLCTEWMNRVAGSTIPDCLPIFSQENVGCILWGLVNGKTQTDLPWGHRPVMGPYTGVWQHDIFRGDHTPYNKDEIDLIRKTIQQ